jgi:integrative and conjugative element protein (TIGR02256 family)
MGEHQRDELFRVVDISVQRSGGSRVCFIRNPKDHESELNRFFARTGKEYTRFNYLGEWHSHPSFEAIPSHTDIQTMQSIVEDPAVGVNFLVLLISKLGRQNEIELTATAFRADTLPTSIPIMAEGDSQAERRGLALRWLV